MRFYIHQKVIVSPKMFHLKEEFVKGKVHDLGLQVILMEDDRSLVKQLHVFVCLFVYDFVLKFYRKREC